jgi:hypothetical protein
MRVLTFKSFVNRNNSYQLPVSNKTEIYGNENDKYVLPKDMPEHDEKNPYTDKKYNNEYIYSDSEAKLKLANGSTEDNISTINTFVPSEVLDIESFKKIKGINSL